MGSLFVLQTNEAQDFAMVTKAAQNIWQKSTWELLHALLGHLSIDGIRKLSKMAIGLEIPSEPVSFFCEPCVFAKQVRHISHQPSERETQALARVYTDLIGPITPTGYDGSRYCLLLTDDATRMTEGELFKSKSQVEGVIPRYINKMERQLKLKLKAFRSDNGGEYVSKQLQKWEAEKGIQWEFTVPIILTKTDLLNRPIGQSLKRCKQCFRPLILKNPYGHLLISGQSS